MVTRTWKLALTALLLLGAGAAPAAAAGRAADLKRELGPGVRVAEHRGTGLVRFVGARGASPIARPAGVSASAAPSVAARAFLGRHAHAFGIRDQARDLRVTASERSTGGGSTVRFQQRHEGVPVLGGELVVNLDRDRNLRSASGEALTGSVDTTAQVGSRAARDAAVAAVAKEQGVLGSALDAEIPSLWIYDAGILGGPGPADPLPVWRVEVSSQHPQPVDELVLIDARRGTVALRIDQIEHALNRTVCDAENSAADVPCTTPVATENGDTGPESLVEDVNLAYEYAGDTYDFYSDLGRDSLNGHGMPLKSTVRYCAIGLTCPYENAFWNGSQMVYGEGYAAADDVVGHELTHGVTEFSSHLFYYFQSGAINESLSDVFGEFVDLTNGGDTGDARWEIAEDIPDGALRDMANPPRFGDPDRMASDLYRGGALDAGGVHTNSGVNNKAAVLITDGGTFNGRTVTGLGIPKAARIYYAVETTMLTSASDYADLATALPQACANLVGTAGITTADCTEVADAVAAVEMGTNPPAAPTVNAPVCASGLVPTNRFADDLENPASGNWATAGVGWYYPQNPNAYGGFDATYATSGTTNLFGDDRGAAGESLISMTRDVAIPAGSTAYLRFNHAYGFESGSSEAFDGGQVVVSTDGGASYQNAGPLLTDGGYNGVLTTTSGNPLGGQAAFVRESNGYTSSRAALTPLAGRSVRFGFRIGTDVDNPGDGWFVDDIRIYTCGPPDADSDGVPDTSDACPSVGASTPSGCPTPADNPIGTPGPSGGTTTVPAVTLRSARLRSCRLRGTGRRARLRCSFKHFGAVRKVSVKVRRKGHVVARGSGRLSRRGLLSIKPRKPLTKGRYTLTLKLTGAGGRTRTLKARLKVLR
jgi:bacillolysin